MFEKKVVLVSGMLIFGVLFIGLASANLLDFFRGVTGKATSNNFNLSVTLTNNAPTIILVTTSASYIGAEDDVLYVPVNFTAYDPDGAGNLLPATATANITKSGEALRTNSTCVETVRWTNYINFTCSIPLWYYDDAGTWNIATLIRDVDSNTAQNLTHTVNVQANANFKIQPKELTFTGVSGGNTNKTAATSLTLNNSGNVALGENTTRINATNLRGQSQSSDAIWAGNFSVGVVSGAGSCNASTMSWKQYVNVTYSYLPRGNHSANNGDETSAQEQLYFCIKKVGEEIIQQTYSTSNETEGSWIIKYT